MQKPHITQQFGHRVRQLRLAAGFTQEAFADKCGFARTYMSRIETGGANPSLVALNVIASALNVSLSDLFSGL
ncbi:transcriptional regulator [Pseudomonas sp. WN033]|nr:transcriptional regulator [Pseudomonas sp. WN033]